MPDENKKPAIAPNDSTNSSDKGQGNTQQQTQQNQQGQQTQDSSAQETQTPDAKDIQQEINQAAQSTTGEQGVSQNTNQGKTKTTSDQKSKTPRPVVEETSAPPTPQQEGNQTAPPQPPSLGNQNENDQAQKSSNSPSGPDQTPTIDSSASEAPPPLPQDGDVSGAPPPPPASDGSSSSPPGNIPPVVTPQKSKKKFGGKKVIATILGLLLLVGGIGAGVILVQQQQDIREQAGVIGLCESDSDCLSGQTCVNGTCEQVPTPRPPAPDDDDGGGGGEQPAPDGPPEDDDGDLPECPPVGSENCTSTQNAPSEGVTCVDSSGQTQVCCPVNKPLLQNGQCTFSQTGEFCDANGCDSNAGPIEGCWVNRYHCDEVSPGGCSSPSDLVQSGVEGRINFQESCGTEQIDVACPLDGDSSVTVDFRSKNYSGNCGTTSTGGNGGLSAQCLNIQAYDTDWNILTQDDLASLQPGDTVRFTVAGSATSGSFDRARFMVNGQRRPDVTQKRPGTQEFYDEITIPENTTQFSINAQLHHSSAGWF